MMYGTWDCPDAEDFEARLHELLRRGGKMFYRRRSNDPSLTSTFLRVCAKHGVEAVPLKTQAIRSTFSGRGNASDAHMARAAELRGFDTTDMYVVYALAAAHSGWEDDETEMAA